jgi:hypothetical protein
MQIDYAHNYAKPMQVSSVVGPSIVNTKEDPTQRDVENLEKVDSLDRPPRPRRRRGKRPGQRGGSGDTPGGSWRSLDAGLYEATLNAATKAAAFKG